MARFFAISARRLGFLNELGKTPLGVMLGIGLVMAVATAIVVPVLSNSAGPADDTPALAHTDPVGCDPSVTSASAGLYPLDPEFPVEEDDVINYRVRAAYQTQPGIPGCTAFNIDIFIDPPGPTGFTLVCNLDSAVPLPGGMGYGSAFVECPNSFQYTAKSADRTGTDLVAYARAFGDKHDYPGDCIVPSPRDPTVIPVPMCFYASGGSFIEMPDPATATNTPTPAPTDTITSTPTETHTPTPTYTASTTPTNTHTPTPTNTGLATPTNTHPPTATATATSTPGGESIVVYNGTLIDGTGGPPVANGAVVIQGERIVYAGPFAGAPVPPGAELIDADGGAILPGVIDTHVHTIGPLYRALDPLTQTYDPLTPWLQSGVTTLQDQGTIKNGVTFHRGLLATIPDLPPRVQLAGPMITAPFGYPTASYGRHLDHEVANAAEARAVVHDLIVNQGVDTIKIAIEQQGGDLDQPGGPVLTAEQVLAITQEAHFHGKIVAAHVTDPLELQRAFQNGVDVAIHTPTTPVSDAILIAARDSGMIFATTVGAFRNPETRANFGRYRELGGRVAVGTDFPYGAPGMPVQEFEAMASVGFSNMQIIQSATMHGAAAIGRSSDLGTLEPGKYADVIVTGGDPLADIINMNSVNTVILQGTVVRRPLPAGADGDGIAQNVDLEDCCFSDGFSDVELGGTTWGSVVHRNGLTVLVTEEPNPAGVRISANGSGGWAVVSPCGDPFATYVLNAGDALVATCGSAIASVITGSVTALFDSILVEIPAGVELTVTNPALGFYDVASAASSTASVAVAGVSVAPGTTVSGIADTDEDGLADSVETDTGVYVSPSDTGTDPNDADSDDDASPDGAEVLMAGSLPFVADSDGDGCADGEEHLRSNLTPATGGDRDPLSPWDFFDVPVPSLTSANASGVRNRAVTLGDVLAIIFYVGTQNDGMPNANGVDYDGDLNGNGTEDGREYDRVPSTVAGQPWHSGAPNGAVQLQDALVARSQVGHSCATAP